MEFMAPKVTFMFFLTMTLTIDLCSLYFLTVQLSYPGIKVTVWHRAADKQIPPPPLTMLEIAWKKHEMRFFSHQPFNIDNYTAHPHDMVHVSAKFQGNTSRNASSSSVRNEWRRTINEECFNISRPGPSVWREIKTKFI